MHRGKYQTQRTGSILPLGIVVVILILILLPKPIDSVMAYMFKQTPKVTNTLEVAMVLPEVQENFDGVTKSNVRIQNKGDVAAYIRVVLVEYWMKDGAIVPAPADVTVTIPAPGDGWFVVDGVYYYSTPVAAGASTGDLIGTMTVTPPDGYTYHLDIHAEAIQADPAEAVKEAWGRTVNEKTKAIS